MSPCEILSKLHTFNFQWYTISKEKKDRMVILYQSKVGNSATWTPKLVAPRPASVKQTSSSSKGFVWLCLYRSAICVTCDLSPGPATPTTGSFLQSILLALRASWSLYWNLGFALATLHVSPSGLLFQGRQLFSSLPGHLPLFPGYHLCLWPCHSYTRLHFVSVWLYRANGAATGA